MGAMTVGRFAGNDLRYRAESHPNQTQFTPEYVLGPVRESLGGRIGLDPCTTETNPTDADVFFFPPSDGAEEPWDASQIFVNPPYGKVRDRWIRKCIKAGEEGKGVILLVPAATDTRIFQAAVGPRTEVVFIQGRVKFGVLRPNRRQVAASHPSCLIGWNVDLSPCGSLGVRMRPRTA